MRAAIISAFGENYIVNQSKINKPPASERNLFSHNIINLIYLKIKLIIVSKRNIIKINFSQLNSKLFAIFRILLLYLRQRELGRMGTLIMMSTKCSLRVRVEGKAFNQLANA